ncbi:MAG: hypothetical protein JZU63_12355, partial [Rhodoferax sp.]|nr:hypothetical protein [Rhodoferax sp.]
MATDINLNDVNFSLNVFSTLKATLTDLMDPTVARELHRTNAPWELYPGTTANITETIRMGDQGYMTMQCVVPYNKATASFAKTVLARIAKKFLGIIYSNPWQKTIMTYYHGQTYPAVKMQCIAKLWDVTTLVLARQLHRFPMDKIRTNVMANIFVKFAMTYISSKACPPMN